MICSEVEANQRLRFIAHLLGNVVRILVRIMMLTKRPLYMGNLMSAALKR